MKNVLVTGSLGQIGTDLVLRLQKEYGPDHIMATDIKEPDQNHLLYGSSFSVLDVRDGEKMTSLVEDNNIDTIIHLAALLSATAEKNPQLAYDINMNGLYTVLEVAREKNNSVFIPSSIAAFGPSTPKKKTPQTTIQRPNTIYGVTKVAGELLCDYYFTKFGVDTRGVRYPGLISNGTLPGGGTTDYAVHIYYEALAKASYTSFIQAGTKMDMMYMPDAIDAILQLMEANPDHLIDRNAFNITAMSFDPEEIAASIQKHIPSFTLDYDVDPVRQAIADSWPESLDDSNAREQWGWKPKFLLDEMTKDMLNSIQSKQAK